MHGHTQGPALPAGRLFYANRVSAIFSLFLLLLTVKAVAQVSTASVNGVVRDPQGAVIPGASIVLRSVETSVEHPSVSNSAGNYVILNITPGRYTIQASAKGFNPQKTEEFALAVDQIATFDFSLKVGSDTQVVAVEATAAQLDVTGATLGTVIETKQVNELPLDGRNFTSLLSLTPGVVPIMVGQNGGMQGSGGFGAAVALGSDYSFPAINGQTGRSNFFLMDGLFNYGTIESNVGGFAAAGGGSLLPGPGGSGFANGSESIDDTPKATDTDELRGTYTQILGSHEIKFGVGFDTANFASPLAQVGMGFGTAQTGDPELSTPTGDAFSSFLLNVPNSGASRRDVNEQERPGGLLSAFLQDSWKATRRLTLNYGLRYDYPFLPRYGTAATVGQNGGPETGDMDFANGTFIVQQLPPLCSIRGYAPCIPGTGLPDHVVVSPNGKITHNVHTNYGPRFGFAFKVDEKTVTHGAFGIVFDDWAAVTQMAQNFEGSWPDIGQEIASSLTNVPTTTQLTPNVTSQDPFAAGGSGLFPPATPFGSNQWFFDPNIKNAYSEQWNFGVQRQLSGSLALRMDYVGSTTHRANVGGLYNTALTPGPGDVQSRAPYPYSIPTFYDRSTGTGNYNALQVQLDKRYTNGFSYQIAYTWAKSLTVDDGWFGIEGQVPQNPYDPQASRGPSATDIPNLFVANGLYTVPIGPGKRFSTGNHAVDYILGNWQLNSVFTWRDGQDFTVVDSADVANTGNGNNYERADVVADIHNGPKTRGEWFNTAAYAVPAQYTYGNGGTNTQRDQRWINLDASIIRSFPIWREKQFQFRAESFNLFNHPIFGQPGNDINNPASFGQIGSSQANLNRQLQMSGKIVF